MSQIKLIQQIRELTAAMQAAKNAKDYETAEDLEYQIDELQEQLEDEEEHNYDERHGKSWK